MVWLKEDEYASYFNNTSPLTAPHISRFKFFIVWASRHTILNATKHFGSLSPLLKKLEISGRGVHTALVETALFCENPPSLRELRLDGVLTDLPRQNFPNLTTLDLRRISNTTVTKISNTRLSSTKSGSQIRQIPSLNEWSAFA